MVTTVLFDDDVTGGQLKWLTLQVNIYLLQICLLRLNLDYLAFVGRIGSYSHSQGRYLLSLEIAVIVLCI